MDTTIMPAKLSYTLLVHAGSYKNFLQKLNKDLPDMKIIHSKQKATHYYVIMITEDGKTQYTKRDIYKLPIMGMREEFSNYLFFKTVKSYNNVLKFMCDGKNDKDAPYTLFQEMLTPLEKMIYGKVNKETKQIQYVLKQNQEPVSMTVYGEGIYNKDTIQDIFLAPVIKIDGKEYSFKEEMKKQNLRVGIIKDA